MSDYYVIRVHSLESAAYRGERVAPYPVWLAEYDVDAHDGRGDAKFTNKKARALHFAGYQDAFEAWSKQSKVRPLRADGKPNRPLTAFTCEIEPA